MDFVTKLGIKIIDVRDEKAAVHMAQAYSTLTNEVVLQWHIKRGNKYCHWHS